jgi:hypothetical protein
MFASLVLIAIAHYPQGGLLPLDLSDPFDSKCRLMLSEIDRSFLKWPMSSSLSWTNSSGSRTSKSVGIVLNRTEIIDLTKKFPGREDLVLKFVLTHEKAHLIQAEVYKASALRFPAVVQELQADIIAASACTGDMFPFKWVPGPDGTMVAKGETAEKTPEQFIKARVSAVHDLMRVGQFLGNAGERPGEHPSSWERRCAVERGVMIGVQTALIPFGLSDSDKFKKALGWKAEDDLASASLRDAYGIAGIRLGTMGKDPGRATLEDADDALGSALRAAVASAADGFEKIKLQKYKETDWNTYFDADIDLPEFQFSSIDVDRSDPDHSELRFFQLLSAPQDINDAQYAGLAKKLTRLCRKGWAESPRDGGEDSPYRWTRTIGSADVAIYLGYNREPEDGKPSIFIKIISDKKPADTASEEAATLLRRVAEAATTGFGSLKGPLKDGGESSRSYATGLPSLVLKGVRYLPRLTEFPGENTWMLSFDARPKPCSLAEAEEHFNAALGTAKSIFPQNWKSTEKSVSSSGKSSRWFALVNLPTGIVSVSASYSSILSAVSLSISFHGRSVL